MWMPRFAYNDEGKILYIKQEHSVAGSWTIPKVFTYETEEVDFSFAGLWVEYNISEVTIKLDNMKGEENKYGFISNVIATANDITMQNTIQTYIDYLNKTVSRDIPKDLLINITNQSRTILKIIDTGKIEPIKGKAYYNIEEERIDIEVTYNKNAISKIIDKNGKILSTSSTKANTGDELIGNGIYKYIVIDNQGNMKQLDLKIDDLKIYIIPDLDTLKQFRDEVNAGNKFEGVKVYQTADISMNEGKYTIDEETNEITFLEDAEQWIPIGATINRKTNYFYGIYNGGNHKISGIYINSNEAIQGLFGNTYGSSTQYGEIKNLMLENIYIKGASRVGGFVGYGGNYTNIENCTSKGQIVATGDYVGGIVGSGKTNLKNCINESKVSGKMRIGGIAGESGNIINCTNRAEVYGTGHLVAGIVGDSSGNIENCYNESNVVGTYGSVAGIAGSANAEYIKKCINKGKVTSEGNYDVSGIVCSTGNATTISECVNIGEVTGGYRVAGIMARSSSTITSHNISNCYNAGKVTASGGYAGGISAYPYPYNGTIQNCYNIGEISATECAGGICGYTSGVKIQNCYNAANITATDYGDVYGIAKNGIINNCYNIGNIIGPKNVYGISANGEVRNCYNIGEIKSEQGDYASGIIGHGKVYDCYNIANITGKGYIGGICANGSNSTIYNSYNIGKISGTKNSGGIVGGNSNYRTTLSNNYYLQTSAECGDGSSASNENAEPRSESEMKNLASILNQLKDSEGNATEIRDIWKSDIGINEGYPILNWQTNNDKLNLINGSNAFIEDIDKINGGYPLLAWQMEINF